MADQTLEEIVAVEREIQSRLAEERDRAAAWLAAERQEISRSGEARIAAARREFRQQLAAAESEAGQEVNDLLHRAESYAARLHDLTEAELRELVGRHLGRLLPEPPA